MPLREAGKVILDGVYNDVSDADGFLWEARQGKAMGFDGKTLIHPGQIAACNEMFSPAADEVAWARKIIAAFQLPENAAKGVITVDGKMVDKPHLRLAERLLSSAGG